MKNKELENELILIEAAEQEIQQVRFPLQKAAIAEKVIIGLAGIVKELARREIKRSAKNGEY